MIKINPKQHQINAVNEVCAILKTESRANIVLPCGTGKTLIGSMVCDALSSASILLLFPSIALIRQTLDFWRETGALDGASCLCVCSDKTVADNDEALVSEIELGMHITTSSDEVAMFFAKPANKQIVLSTYQSAPVVAAGMPHGMSFDIAIFDEAHRTASGESSLFSFALDENNIRITNRLFMTATPKHIVDVIGVNGAFSMDNETVYGKRAYVLPIRQAIDDGLISDYQVLVSVVTSSDVADEFNEKNRSSKSPSVKNMVAMAIAIKKAIQATGAKKIFSFHRTINAANSFANSLDVRNILDYPLLHVSGKMNSKVRSGVIKGFSEADRCLITNARCLTEGVDVPSVDMIVFADAKESTVDIVQAVGRAMRITPDKSVGYILLPIFIDLEKHSGDVEAAIRTSGMSTIWDVLTRMSEQESMIALKNSTKSELREARKNRIEYRVLGSDNTIAKKLHDHIDVYYANRNASVFDENYKKLAYFFEINGHCNPSFDEDEALNVWLRRVRFSYQQGKLSADNILRLELIGFSWDGRDPFWEKNFQDFLQGKETVKWRSVQRRDFRGGKIKPEREKRLRDAGFKFEYVRGETTKIADNAECPDETEFTNYNAKWKAYFDHEDNKFCGSLPFIVRAFGLRPELMESPVFCMNLIKILDSTSTDKFTRMHRVLNEAIIQITGLNLNGDKSATSLVEAYTGKSKDILKKLQEIPKINGMRTITKEMSLEIRMSSIWMIGHALACEHGAYLMSSERALGRKAAELGICFQLPNGCSLAVTS